MMIGTFKGESMEKQSVGLKLDQYFTKEEFIKYIKESITDEDIEQMFKDANLTKDDSGEVRSC